LWLSLYKDRKRALAKVLDFITEVDPSSHQTVSVVLGANAFASELRKSRKDRQAYFASIKDDPVAQNEFKLEVIKAAKELRPGIEKLDQWHRDEISLHIPFSSDVDAFEQEFIAPILFTLNIWLCSWSFYTTSPTQLLRKARLGDEKALEKIVRLDGSILHDSRISKRLHKLRLINMSKYKKIMRLADKGPKQKMDKINFKTNIAAMLHWISVEQSKMLPVKKLTYNQVHDLFDCYAKDKGQDMDLDLDLHDSPEAFEQAVRRAKNKMGLRPLTDKTSKTKKPTKNSL